MLARRTSAPVASLAIFIALVASRPAFPDTFVVSDLEGSGAKLEALVKEGKLKWVGAGRSRRLEFTNPRDSLVFLGDLSGPNWLDTEHPQNIFLREVFIDLKRRHPTRFDFVWGNHEANRFGFIRENMRMERGEHAEYRSWLAQNGKTDTVENRVSYWGKETYGTNKEGVALPIADYQREMGSARGRPVTVTEAAEQFADDLRVGKPGRAHGRMLQLLLTGQESTIRSGYAMTHAPIRKEAQGVIPLEGARSGGGASWLRARNERFFKPQIRQFIADVQQGRVPSSMIPDIGDARWDATGKRVVNDAASLSYTERAKVGDQYRGVEPEVARAFAEDPQIPTRGMLTGHKPAGNFATVHRQEVGSSPFFDVVVDTSRGADGIESTVTIKDNGDLVIAGRTGEGEVERWTVNRQSDPLIGKVLPDGFHIKGETRDGRRYILERYVGYSLEGKVITKSELAAAQTAFSLEDRALNEVTRAKVASLENAVRANGGQLLADSLEASRVVGDRFILDMRGASKWAAVDEAKGAEIRRQLVALAERLDPKKVVILTGGNRASHPNAVENMVHDIFAGTDAKRKFDIIGFMKHDIPADEVDPAVRYVVMVGDGDNWEGPVLAAQRFVSEHRGATLMWGGGGILERALETDISAGMSERTLLVQGFGGASETKAGRGVGVRSVDEIIQRLRGIDPTIFRHAATERPLNVGIYTGSFDPPHAGHRRIVEQMKLKFGLDVVYVVPDHTVAYKPGMQSIEDRNRMIQLEFKDVPGIRVLSTAQRARLGPGELWNVTRVVKGSHPKAKLFSLMGTDTLAWYQALPPQRHDSDVTILVNRRDAGATVPDRVGAQRVIGVDLQDEGISSTAVRRTLRSGRDSPHLSPAVNRFIRAQGLYAPVIETADPERIAAAFRTRGKRVVTLVGYSGAEYEDKAGMLAEVRAKLSALDPRTTVINIGATPEGIGEAYAIAKELGFETAGIVSSQAQRYSAELSDSVDRVYYVVDETWGGFIPGTDRLSPTSQAMVAVSDELIGFGGGAVGRDEMLAARRLGKPVRYSSYEMNHEVARRAAAKKSIPPPTSFTGAADLALNPPTKSAAELRAVFKATGKRVVTFIGYSGAEYEDKPAMLKHARAVLEGLDPKNTLINIGGTPEGIGAVYELAKSMGFETAGIVSSEAKKYGGLSQFVDHPYYVQDARWGGIDPATGRLSPTSEAMVGVSDRVIAIGGGEVGRDELAAAAARGIEVEFIPADMNHRLAIEKALKKGQPAPSDFRGAAAEAGGAVEPALVPCLIRSVLGASRKRRSGS